MRRSLAVLFVLLTWTLGAQTLNFSKNITLQFQGEPLESALQIISQSYGIKFAYSKDIIPLNQPMYADIHHKDLKAALDELFAQTQIIFGYFADQIALSIDPQKIPERPIIAFIAEPAKEEVLMASTEDFPERLTYALHPIEHYFPSSLPHYNIPDIALYKKINDYDPFNISEEETFGPKVHLGVFPPMQGYIPNRNMGPAHFSLNVLWGMHESVHGVEIGGLGNSLGGEMQGLQIGGLFNTVKVKSKGMQIGGITNISNEIDGLQTAGITNIAFGTVHGMQIAGIANLAKRGGQVIQIGGVANTAKGSTVAQIGGIFNTSDEVTVQVSGIVNQAKKVRGVQIGLINLADTVEGVSIGLLSFIKEGYHSIGIGAEDAILGQMQLRLGSRRFYNIFSIGGRLDKDIWSLGFGIGTSLNMNKNHFLQLEAMSHHVNEGATWTSDLNLLNQFKVLADLQLSKGFRLAFGPSYNVAVSHRYDEDSGTFGMSIKKHTLFDKTFTRDRDRPLNVKMWLGFHLGLRYDLNHTMN